MREGDTDKDVEVLSSKIGGLRIFTDENDKMNLSVNDIGGSIMVVSNFSALRRCQKKASVRLLLPAAPKEANRLYGSVC